MYPSAPSRFGPPVSGNYTNPQKVLPISHAEIDAVMQAFIQADPSSYTVIIVGMDKACSPLFLQLMEICTNWVNAQYIAKNYPDELPLLYFWEEVACMSFEHAKAIIDSPVVLNYIDNLGRLNQNEITEITEFLVNIAEFKPSTALFILSHPMAARLRAHFSLHSIERWATSDELLMSYFPRHHFEWYRR